MEKQFYTIKEVAALTGKHRNTIRNYLDGGLIKYVKIQNAVLIPCAEIERITQAAAFGGAILAPVVAESAEVQ